MQIAATEERKKERKKERKIHSKKFSSSLETFVQNEKLS
jgi:hypothetical protein